jgi:hypothetical protein
VPSSRSRIALRTDQASTGHGVTGIQIGDFRSSVAAAIVDQNYGVGAALVIGAHSGVACHCSHRQQVSPGASAVDSIVDHICHYLHFAVLLRL